MSKKTVKLHSPDDLKGLKITVMGLGLHGGGVATVQFLVQQGALVTATDLRDEVALEPSLQRLLGLPVRYVLGRHEKKDFADADIVIKNPAAPANSYFLSLAPAIETDISLFLRFSKSYLIAVTGSKGKSTVASAIHYCLSQERKKAMLGGNITISPLSFLHTLSSEQPVILELSSWQLADLAGKNLLRPNIAIITSIMADHMDRYPTMESYVNDKKLMYADQKDKDILICNRDDKYGKLFASEAKGRIAWYADAACANWAEEQGPRAWLAADQEALGYFSKTAHPVPTSKYENSAELLLGKTSAVWGRHGRKNLLAAALACRLFGLSARSISERLSVFPGLEHRMEFFAKKNGIAWCNDSAATVPQAVSAAVDSIKGTVILITGGTNKNINFDSILPGCSRVKAILLLAGTGSDEIIKLFGKNNIAYKGPFDSLKEAVYYSLALASFGDTILLSPGCTSFGMFANEFDRGRQFKALVKELLDQKQGII